MAEIDVTAAVSTVQAKMKLFRHEMMHPVGTKDLAVSKNVELGKLFTFASFCGQLYFCGRYCKSLSNPTALHKSTCDVITTTMIYVSLPSGTGNFEGSGTTEVEVEVVREVLS